MLAVLVLAGVAAGIGFWVRSAQQTRERKESLRLYQLGRFADARPLLQRAFERNPDDQEVVKALAIGCFDAHEFAEAEPYLDGWCALQPGQTEPFLRRLELAVQRGKVDQAVEDGEHLLELEPGNPTLRQRVLFLFLTNGRFAETERACRRLLRGLPNDLSLRYYLAEACHEQGKDDEAARLLDRLLQEQPRFLEALMLRGVLYYQAGRDDQAIALLQKVVAQKPSQQAARHYLGLALARAGKTTDARGELARMLQLNETERLLIDKDFQPHNLELQLKAAEALLKSGRTADGFGIIQQVLTRDPRNAEAQRLRAAYQGTPGTRQGTP
jgi:predicted Zn-dependent protease